MGCSGRSFAVEGSRRGKPLKSKFSPWRQMGTRNTAISTPQLDRCTQLHHFFFDTCVPWRKTQLMAASVPNVSPLGRQKQQNHCPELQGRKRVCEWNLCILNIGLRVSGLSFGFSGSPCFLVVLTYAGYTSLKTNESNISWNLMVGRWNLFLEWSRTSHLFIFGEYFSGSPSTSSRGAISKDRQSCDPQPPSLGKLKWKGAWLLVDGWWWWLMRMMMRMNIWAMKNPGCLGDLLGMKSYPVK